MPVFPSNNLLNQNTTLTARHPALLAPMEGQISAQINRLTGDIMREIMAPRDKYKLDDYINMLEQDPTSKACVELKALRATITLGDYQHKDKDAQEWIKGNFDSMDGALAAGIGQLCSAMPLGFAVAEINFTNKAPGRYGEWRLESINILDPRRITFRGAAGRINEVVYRDGMGRKKYIPYKKCLHVVNGLATTFNEPFGSAEARRAMPYYRAKQLMLAELTVAAKNQATGIITAFADSNDSVRLLGADGKPVKNPDGTDKIVSAQESLLYQLQGLENSSILVTDLKNRVAPMQLPSGENFFNINLQFLNRQILMSYGVSALMFDEGSSGGLGNTGISQAHRSVLDSQIEAIVTQLRDKILENVVRPLLVYNFGSKYAQNLGSFSMQPYTDPTLMMQKGQFLLQAITAGVIPASDITAINALREFAGIAPISYEDMQSLIEAQTQTQAAQQGVSAQPDPLQQAPSVDPSTNPGYSGYPG